MPTNPNQTDLTIPIACALPPAGLAERSANLKAGLFTAVEETRTLPDGIAYRFTGADEQLHALFAFIEAERTCCGFLRFELAVEPAHGPIWLRITGPDEAQSFIQETFG